MEQYHYCVSTGLHLILVAWNNVTLLYILVGSHSVGCIGFSLVCVWIWIGLLVGDSPSLALCLLQQPQPLVHHQTDDCDYFAEIACLFDEND